MIAIKLILIEITIILLIIDGTQSINCLALESTNSYGGSRSGSCFEVLVSHLKGIIVHTQTSVVGFTFIFTNGSNTSFLENPVITNSVNIDLTSMYLTGLNVYTNPGVHGIQFILSNSVSTQTIGDSSGRCFDYLNSTFLKSQYLEIKMIYGCIDNNNSQYFPYLALSYSFSQCPLRTTITTTSTTSITSTTPFLCNAGLSIPSGLSPSTSFTTIFSIYQKREMMTTYECSTAYFNLNIILKSGTSTSTLYYAFNWQYAKMTTYDYQWNYVTNGWAFGGFGSVYSVVLQGSYYYMLRSGDFWRFGLDFANGVQATGVPSSPDYYQVAYYSTTNQLYCGSRALKRIDVYSMAMAYVSNIPIPVSAGVGQGLVFYNNLMYVPGTSGQITIVNASTGVVSSTVTVSQCSGTMGQLLFDSNGNYAVACYSNSKVVLYNSINTYVAQFTTGAKPQMAMIDDVGRFVVATNAALELYY